MAAVNGRFASYNIDVHWDPDGTLWGATAPTEAAIDSFITANAKLVDVTSLDALDSSRNIIDLPLYGQDRAGQLPGQINGSSLVFEVVFNANNATHVALRDDDGTTEQPFLLVYNQGTDNMTYAAFDGYTGGYSMSQPVDGAWTMEITVPISNTIHWVDDSA